MNPPRLNLRDTVAKYVPGWLSNRPPLPGSKKSRNVGFRWIWSFVLLCDFILEGLVEGIYAAWPIYAVKLGRQDSLPYIGRTRGIIQGESESAVNFAKRLAAWLDTWVNAGWEYALAREIQLYLATVPTVTIITRGQTPAKAHWTIVSPDGSVVRTTAPWDWDSISNPTRQSPLWWADMWIVIQPPEWAIQTTTAGETFAQWGAGGFGLGHLVSRNAYATLKRLIDQWISLHVYVQAIIFSYDPTWFTPTSPPLKLPNGTWGQWCVAGGGQARSNVARYWEPQAHAGNFPPGGGGY